MLFDLGFLVTEVNILRYDKTPGRNISHPDKETIFNENDHKLIILQRYWPERI